VLRGRCLLGDAGGRQDGGARDARVGRGSGVRGQGREAGFLETRKSDRVTRVEQELDGILNEVT
jgi:hypothetical protein